MPDIVSIGAATVDIFVRSSALILKNKLLSLPSSSKNEIDEGLFCSGGGATNSAVSFSRLGLKPILVSLIGQSYLNNYIFDDLKKNKVDSTLIVQDKKDITDFSVILVDKDGSRSILADRGQGGLQEKDIPWSKIKSAKWFYLSSLEGNLDLLEKLIGFAKENDIKISLNPGSRELSQGKKLFPLLKFIDFLLLNQQEAETLVQVKHDHNDFFPKIKKLNNSIIAITNGRLGAHIFTPDQHLYSPIINVNPVDETGAGDSFGSTFVAALYYKKDPQQALFWAIKNSASTVAHLGSKTGLLTLKEIKRTSKKITKKTIKK
jgi:ribokinase